MSTKLHRLRQPKTKSNKAIISFLQETLENARTRKMVSIAIACEYKDTRATTHYIIDNGGSIPALIGNVERVKNIIVKDWLEETV